MVKNIDNDISQHFTISTVFLNMVKDKKASRGSYGMNGNYEIRHPEIDFKIIIQVPPRPHR